MRDTILMLILIGVGALGSACAREPAAPAPPAPPAATGALQAGSSAVVCDFDTPLVPGVPGSPGHLIPSDINPNGASELATLMREMTADLEEVRAGLEGGAAPGPLVARHTRIRCSWPTDPGDRTPEFRALAHNYLTRLEALESAPPAERRAAFDAVVTACRSCHERSCSGPIPRIEKLRL